MSALARRIDSPEPLSAAAWALLGEDEPGELVDGQIVAEEEVTWMHDETAAWLIGVLWPWLRRNRGRIATSDVRYQIRLDRGRKPDLSLFLAGSTMPAPRSALVTTPPTIAVEILSPRPSDIRRDRVEKMQDYAGFGVQWCWIVDPNVRLLEIFRLRADGPSERCLGASEGTAAIPGCEGLVLDLDDLWRSVAGDEEA